MVGLILMHLFPGTIPEATHVAPAYIIKYNKFIDNIVERFNRKLKSFDPVNIRLDGPPNNGNGNKNSNKNNRPKNKPRESPESRNNNSNNNNTQKQQPIEAR